MVVPLFISYIIGWQGLQPIKVLYPSLRVGKERRKKGKKES
jgi:hypothetical protein